MDEDIKAISLIFLALVVGKLSWDFIDTNCGFREIRKIEREATIKEYNRHEQNIIGEFFPEIFYEKNGDTIFVTIDGMLPDKYLARQEQKPSALRELSELMGYLTIH